MSKACAIQRALISVSNKKDLLPFVHELVARGVEILATGGTAQWLIQHHYPVTQVSDFTGFPEIMGGRVKTLHPKIFSGILRRPHVDRDIQSIDLVVVNLYPFAETIANPQCLFQDAIENMDIGGPSLLRAAAKNQEVVTVICNPADYGAVITEIKQNGNTSATLRRQLAAKVFAYTSEYDQIIYQYLTADSFPEHLQITAVKKNDLRYGENPHQQAALYIDNFPLTSSLANATLLQGKALSYCNLLDSDAALNTVLHLDPHLPGCVIVKHATPCGVAQAKNLSLAYQQALAADPASAFGGIIAFNRALDIETAQILLAQPLIEVILAPEIPEVVAALFKNKSQWRLLRYGHPSVNGSTTTFQRIRGGLLMQTVDSIENDTSHWQVVTKRKPTADETKDLKIAWQVAAFTKSNAIVIAKNQQTLGIGGGQTSRVFSAKIALMKATECHHVTQFAVAASDGFFPFADGLQILTDAGVSAIIQPGGSKKDPEVIAAADATGISMIFTGKRHFRH